MFIEIRINSVAEGNSFGSAFIITHEMGHSLGNLGYDK